MIKSFSVRCQKLCYKLRSCGHRRAMIPQGYSMFRHTPSSSPVPKQTNGDPGTRLSAAFAAAHNKSARVGKSHMPKIQSVCKHSHSETPTCNYSRRVRRRKKNPLFVFLFSVHRSYLQEKPWPASISGGEEQHVASTAGLRATVF